MKKFSKVKYFGAVAAALLAVAPIAAPVVSQVAAPATVQAAAAVPNGNDNATYATALDKAFNDNVSGTEVLGFKGVDFAAVNNTTDVTTALSSKFVRLFRQSNVDPDFGAGTKISFTSKDFKAVNNDSIAQEFNGNSRTVYTFTITLKNAFDAVLATKDVVLNVAKNSKANVTAATYQVGDSVKSLNSGTNAASAITLTDRNGKTTPITDGDLSIIGYKNTKTQGDTPKGIYDVTYPNGKAVASSATEAFTNNGIFYQYIKLSGSLFAPNGKYSSVDPAVAATNANAYSFWNGADLYIARPVTVTTGTNDAAYFPIVKFTTGADNSGSNTTTTAYYNGDTISDAKITAFAGSNLDDGSAYNKLAASLYSLFDVPSTNTQGNPKSNAFRGYENSIKGGGLDDGLDYASGYYTIAGVHLTGNATSDKAAITAALPKYIKSNYAEGTTNIPVSVTNERQLTSTVYVPVVITTNVGTPVATEFSGYTTVVKGDKFDEYADVQFKNSSIDNGVIPNSRIKVTSNVDTTTPGTYTVTYVVTNAAGKSATFTRTVVVTAGDLTESNASGVVYINNASGAKVYSDTATSKETGNTLDNTTAWKYSSVVKDNAGKIVAYNLGGKQYVKAADVATSPVKAQAGVFTVHYPANAKWSIAVYNSDLKVIKLIPANSTWATFGTKTLKDGKSYYNLGGNQFARTDYGFWNAK